MRVVGPRQYENFIPKLLQNYLLKTLMGCHRPRPHQNLASTWWLPKLATVTHNAIGVANSYTIFGVTLHPVLPPYTPVQ
jgi:hypothetical protein